MPEVLRSGYTHNATVWKDYEGNTYNLNSSTTIGAAYYPQKTLYALIIGLTLYSAITASLL